MLPTYVFPSYNNSEDIISSILKFNQTLLFPLYPLLRNFSDVSQDLFLSLKFSVFIDLSLYILTCQLSIHLSINLYVR